MVGKKDDWDKLRNECKIKHVVQRWLRSKRQTAKRKLFPSIDENEEKKKKVTEANSNSEHIGKNRSVVVNLNRGCTPSILLWFNMCLIRYLRTYTYWSNKFFVLNVNSDPESKKPEDRDNSNADKSTIDNSIHIIADYNTIITADHSSVNVINLDLTGDEKIDKAYELAFSHSTEEVGIFWNF